MNLRPQPQPMLDHATSGGARADLRPPLGGGESELRGLRADLRDLAEQIAANAAQTGELRRGIIAIWQLLAPGDDKRRAGEIHTRLNEISERLATLERRLDSGEPASVAPAARQLPTDPPRPAPAAAPSFRAAPAAEPSPAQPASAPPAPADVGAQWRMLTGALGIADSEGSLAKVEASARRQLSCDTHAEATVVSAFGLLPQLAPQPDAAALEAFVTALLGTAATLILPSVGEGFDRARHEDHSTFATGTRSRVRTAVFPGVEAHGRVLVRAIVNT